MKFRKLVSAFLAAVTAATSALCFTASALTATDLLSEMRKYRITQKTELSNAMSGFYKTSSAGYSIYVSGISAKSAAKITELTSDEDHVLAASIMLDNGAGFAYTGGKGSAMVYGSTSNGIVKNAEFAESGSGIRLVFELEANGYVKKALEEAKAAVFSVSAVGTADGKRTYLGGTKAYYIPFSDKDTTVAKISSLNIKKIGSKQYTGRKIEPVPEIYDGGYKLRKGSDYTVTYENNIDVGVATAIIKGRGSYKGTKKVNFTILPMSTSFNRAYWGPDTVRVTWHAADNVDKYHVYRSDDMGVTFYQIGEFDAGTREITMDFPFGSDFVIKIRTSKTVGGKTYYSRYSKSSEMVHGL